MTVMYSNNGRNKFENFVIVNYGQNVITFIYKFSPYRAVNTLRLSYKNQSFKFSFFF